MAALTPCVVFDFGNVISFFDHMRACRQLAALSRAALRPEQVYAAIFETPLEDAYDCGRISTDQFIEQLRRDLDLHAPDDAIATAWCDIFTPNPAITAPLAAQKTRGARLVLASNTNELHHRWFSTMFEDILVSFDDQVLSYKLGARKPDLRFFEACIDACRDGPECMTYIDDRPDFVEIARDMGMRAFVYNHASPSGGL